MTYPAKLSNAGPKRVRSAYDNGATIEALAERFGTDEETIREYLTSRVGISFEPVVEPVVEPKRGRGRPAFVIDETQLRAAAEANLTVAEIAAASSLSLPTVSKHLRRLGVVRSRGAKRSEEERASAGAFLAGLGPEGLLLTPATC